MTQYQSLEERQKTSQALRQRILNTLPAASYQMEQFLSLTDVTLSNDTQSAAIECGPQPTLLLNEAFIAKYCRRDEHLLMLVLHELYHVIFGHSSLFPRLTQAHNIVFDAVINALLCQQFRDQVYIEFFQKINSTARFPGRLPRPPKGWPQGLNSLKELRPVSDISWQYYTVEIPEPSPTRRS